ncbi:hypothetical protein [Streptomyces sp. SID12488]|uniref:hypothetical protein n=1 Tax=Streptomyces sp. SID12488 TaxID=2706040 RepID=UPI0013DD4B66|nr:hypothetical protein [Streptomyces sp. SID12488]NEA67449.1 hypothetical protein [Streptomyces sp. SID12488]
MAHDGPVTGNKESGTRVAYLCDVGPLGLGRPAGQVDPSASSTTRPAQLTFRPPEHDPSRVSDPCASSDLRLPPGERMPFYRCLPGSSVPDSAGATASASVHIPMGMNGKS